MSLHAHVHCRLLCDCLIGSGRIDEAHSWSLLRNKPSGEMQSKMLSLSPLNRSQHFIQVVSVNTETWSMSLQSILHESWLADLVEPARDLPVLAMLCRQGLTIPELHF